MAKRILKIVVVLVLCLSISIIVASMSINFLFNNKEAKEALAIATEVADRYLEKYWAEEFNSFYINPGGKI